MITKDLLQTLFTYNKETGELINKTPYHKTKRSSKNYLSKRVLGKKYLVHQLVFMYMKGYIPKLIDHIDGDIQNNSWSNLRETTKRVNKLNTDKPIGCYNRGKTWYARCKSEGKIIHLGTFNSFEEAKSSYDNYKKGYR